MDYTLCFNIGLVILGFVLLIKGGDFLVDGAVAIARRAHLSPMVIGLTIVGFGTSAPELLVSMQAALAGSPGIAVGNVVGSNIANVALILGVTAIIRVCSTSRQTLAIDTPFMIASSIAFVAVAMCGTIGRIAGAVGVLALVAFICWQVINSRKNNQESDDDAEAPMALWKALMLVVVSIAALSYGADWLIEGARGIATKMGVSERIIGLTVIAVGTSLPELFASIMAARKGETDMAIGNVIGSITFNILSVIGISAIICPITGTNEGFLFDYLVMLFLEVLLWIFLFTNRKLEHWEGYALLLIYISYIAYTTI
ncbi:MAG: calcium/sodium antiporter [Bacteroidales bacterium]|nr:calcium/sodium antiporter [Bacteroidales bacterium]